MFKIYFVKVTDQCHNEDIVTFMNDGATINVSGYTVDSLLQEYSGDESLVEGWADLHGFEVTRTYIDICDLNFR